MLRLLGLLMFDAKWQRNMGLILKIAAGIIIGFLAFQILMPQRIDLSYEERRNEMQETQVLKNKFIALTNSIHYYYRKKSKVPKFISDLKCRDLYRNMKKMDCASIYKDGVFYVNYGDDWVSAEPYILGGKIFNKCKTSNPFYGDDRYRDCLKLDVNSIPDNISPPFYCNKTTEEIEKIICSSDRLIEYDIYLHSIYKGLLSNSQGNKKQQIKDDQINFINLRRKRCHTSECISMITKRKIARLELMGVFEK